MHGCGWDSGAARERSSALAASVASRYALGADGVGAARPGARGSGSLPRATRSAPKAGGRCPYPWWRRVEGSRLIMRVPRYLLTHTETGMLVPARTVRTTPENRH